MLRELFIHAVAGTSSKEDQSMVLLKEKDGDRILPIMTSSRRAMSLLMRKQFGLPLPVPISPADIGCQMLLKFGVRLTSVELTTIQDGTFISRVVAKRGDEEHSVDFCQAPDGLIMAATANCPIMIEEELLEAQYMRPTGAHSYALNINTLSRQMLEDALQHAVETENYEAASRLRDELAKRTPEQDNSQA